jgi:hypothetical protein
MTGMTCVKIADMCCGGPDSILHTKPNAMVYSSRIYTWLRHPLSQNVTTKHVFRSCPCFFSSSCFPRCVVPSWLDAERLSHITLASKSPRSPYATYTTLIITSPPKFLPRWVSFRCCDTYHFSYHNLQCNATCDPILTTLANCTSWSCACTEANAQAVEDCGDCVVAVVPKAEQKVQFLLDGTSPDWSFLSLFDLIGPQNLRRIAHQHLFLCRQRSLLSRLHQLLLQLLLQLPLRLHQILRS